MFLCVTRHLSTTMAIEHTEKGLTLSELKLSDMRIFLSNEKWLKSDECFTNDGKILRNHNQLYIFEWYYRSVEEFS